MKSVGQFDQYDPYIVCHGEEHLSNTLCLTLQRAVKGKGTQIGYSGNNMHHLRAKHLLNVFSGCMGIFDHIMQKAGSNTHQIKLHIRQNSRHFKGVRQVWLTG